MATRVLAATLVAGALLVSLGSSAGGAPGGGTATATAAGGAGSETTLRFVTHQRKFREVDLEPVGRDSAGDHFWSAGVVFNRAHSRRIGRYVFRCEATPIGFSCYNTTHLRGRGKLYMSQTSVGPDAKGIVLGGTGRFVGVRGQGDAVGRENDHAFDVNFTVELIR